MTIKELSQLFYLEREINSEIKKREGYEAEATKTTQTLSDMPSGGAMSDKTAIGADIADCTTIIESKRRQAVAEYNRIVRYIAGVDDAYIRQIIKYRFIDLMSWAEVAKAIGGNNTRETVRKALTRYLEKN